MWYHYTKNDFFHNRLYIKLYYIVLYYVMSTISASGTTTRRINRLAMTSSTFNPSSPLSTNISTTSNKLKNELLKELEQEPLQADTASRPRHIPQARDFTFLFIVHRQ